MHKKLMLACMAIAAFAAFVIAPSAWASPTLTSNGVAVPVGTSITGTTTGLAVFTGPEVECNGHLVGTVTQNNGSQVKGEVPAGSAGFTGTGASGDCTSSIGDVAVTVNSKLCMETEVGKDTIKVTGCGAAVTFSLKATSLGVTCKYSTASVVGNFNTNAAATVNLEKQPATGESTNSFLCPANGTLDMDFDLYTTGGTLLTVS
jgi:hypothetical protein